jgi:3-hexulose-6-phosphate synthase
MTPYLWIAYDYVDLRDCLTMLDGILARHPQADIIHEIGRPTLLHAALAGVPIVAEFRKRLVNKQPLVADFKGFDVPYVAEGKYYYAAGADIVTVMAMAPNEAIREAIDGARADAREVAFDLMTYLDDDFKAARARELTAMGATLVSCHTGWSEQAAGKSPDAVIEKVCRALEDTDARVIAMGGLKPGSVGRLRPYAEKGKLFAVVAGSAITRSKDPNAVVGELLDEIASLGSAVAGAERPDPQPLPMATG